MVVVAGDTTLADALALARRTYGQVTTRHGASGAPPRVRPPEAQSGGIPARIEVRDAAVGQANWRRRYLAPTYGHGPAAPALDVAAYVLGGDSSSRLHRVLVLDEGLALNAGVSYSGEHLDSGTLTVFATPADGVSLEQLENRIDALLAETIRGGLSEDDVARSRLRLVDSTAYTLDSLFGPVRIVGSALTTGQSLMDVVAWPDRIASVTADAASAALAAVLSSDRRVTGLLLPSETAP